MYFFIDFLLLTFGKELYKKSVFTAAVRSTSFLLLRMKHASASSILQNTTSRHISVTQKGHFTMLSSIYTTHKVYSSRRTAYICMYE